MRKVFLDWSFSSSEQGLERKLVCGGTAYEAVKREVWSYLVLGRVQKLERGHQTLYIFTASPSMQEATSATLCFLDPVKVETDASPLLPFSGSSGRGIVAREEMDSIRECLDMITVLKPFWRKVLAVYKNSI